jgi:NAD(P)-dependent dehydrogenase (short-subunit alcohol dehydrogenase family)
MFGVVCSVSKTALNAITLSFAIELESTNIKTNAACLGFTATGLNNFEGTQAVEQAGLCFPTNRGYPA